MLRGLLERVEDRIRREMDMSRLRSKRMERRLDQLLTEGMSPEAAWGKMLEEVANGQIPWAMDERPKNGKLRAAR